MSARDAADNAAQGSALFVDANGCYVDSEKQLVALLWLGERGRGDDRRCGPGGAARRCRRPAAAWWRKLKNVAPAVTEDHLKVHRPWGSYQSLDQAERFQVKRIVVKQGGRLSLQLHHHRAEHWVIVRGTARVTIGDQVKILHENELIYVPIGARHRLENPGKIDLELIEVQTGSYLGEDDIVRVEDDYHRS